MSAAVRHFGRARTDAAVPAAALARSGSLVRAPAWQCRWPAGQPGGIPGLSGDLVARLRRSLEVERNLEPNLAQGFFGGRARPFVLANLFPADCRK